MIKRAVITLTFIMLIPFSIACMATTTVANSQAINVTTQDNINIVGRYQLPTLATGTLPLVLFIHQGGSSKEEWIKQPIWQMLINQGYAVLAFDLRQHGESEIDKDDLVDLFSNPKRAPLDLLAVLDFISKDPRIDKTRVGILGASVGANLAVMAASIDDYQVKSVVAMSGKVEAAQSLSGMQTTLQPHNVFSIASQKEQAGLRKEWAQQWFDVTKGHRKIMIAPGQEHGSSILADTPMLNQQIVEWFTQTL